MTASAREDTRHLPSPLMSVGVLVGVVTAVIPLATMLVGGWIVGAAIAVIAIVAAGYLGRCVRRNGDLLALGAQLVVWLAAVVIAFPAPVLGGLVPIPGTGWGLPSVLRGGVIDLVEGVAPVQTGPALAFLLIAATGLIALAVDQLAATARLSVVASLPLILVFALPHLVVPRSTHLWLAIPLAAAILTMVAAGGPARAPGRPRRTLLAVTSGIAVVAIVASLALAPRLPFGGGSGTGLFSSGASVDVSLDLGDDLRSSTDVEVARVLTDEGATPYLRLATHTLFDEDGWTLDENDELTVPLGAGFDEVTAPEGIEMITQQTRIEIIDLDTDRLPVPPDTVSVSGATSGWQAQRDNRTVVGEGMSSLGEEYTVRAVSPHPTPEQAQDSPWFALSEAAPAFGDLAETMLPPSLSWDSDLAQIPFELTGMDPDILRGSPGGMSAEYSRTTPYDALVALERWFRSDEFSYSLEAPVEGGFDGSTEAAMEAFLEVREGYCVHFASTFAVMARALGIPTRVAVGYLPGQLTGDTIDGRPVTSVRSEQLHAWPEAYLWGIGWVAFDPTPGVASAQGEILEEEEAPEETAEPTPTPTPTPTEQPDEEMPEDVEETQAPEDTDAGSEGVAWSVPWRAIGVVLLVAFVLAIPALVRLGARVRHTGRARNGDAGAAWRELRQSAIDAGIPMNAAESPRAFGDRLITAGAPAESVGALVTAIENASFAPDAGSPQGLDEALANARRGLRRAGIAGVLDAWLPRSLFRRS